MKHIKSLILGILGVLLVASQVFATGTYSMGNPSYVKVEGSIKRVVLPLTMTADSSASFAAYTLNPSTYGIEGWYLYKVETDPGSTGPTNGAWDLDITDANGFVVSRNLVDDRSSTATQEVIFSSGYPIILGSWIVSVGDNAVNSASVVIYFTFVSN